MKEQINDFRPRVNRKMVYDSFVFAPSSEAIMLQRTTTPRQISKKLFFEDNSGV
jgi:hypothetical protein